jgi:hypothetical protein
VAASERRQVKISLAFQEKPVHTADGMSEFQYRGRALQSEDILYIRELISAHPNHSRRSLSRKLCEAWQWRQANGALCDMVCRGLLLMLDRAGQIALPPVAYVRHNPLANRVRRPLPVRMDQTSIAGPLQDLQPLEFQQVRRTAEEGLFNSLLEEHHYLKYEQPVGEHLKYVVWARQRPVACLAWSSAPRHLGSRDRYIGWNSEARRRNIRFVAYNSRFLILPWVRVPHSQPHGSADLRGLATPLRAPPLFSGNIRGPGAISWNLLSCGQLGFTGPDDGARQTIQQLRAEPIDQRSSGISVDEAVSRTARGVG